MTVGYTGNPSPETSSSLLLATLTGSKWAGSYKIWVNTASHTWHHMQHSVQVYTKLLSSTIYRHSEETIEKLESAGLGFYVRATETQQKLGKCANANGCSLMRGGH